MFRDAGKRESLVIELYFLHTGNIEFQLYKQDYFLRFIIQSRDVFIAVNSLKSYIHICW